MAKFYRIELLGREEVQTFSILFHDDLEEKKILYFAISSKQIQDHPFVMEANSA